MTLRRSMLAAAACAGLALPATAQQRIPVGHLTDLTGPTSDVGVSYAAGITDTLNWVNSARGGVGGRQLAVSPFDYGYQAPRAIAQYNAWTSRERVVAIQGWGTADTEALIQFVTRDRIPYISASYSAALTDPNGKARPDSKPAPYNFFYGPSYSDAARALIQWAAEDWKARGQQGRPKYVHMGANHPYPNSPKEAGESLARELGFDVLPPIVYALTPGDYTAQCLTLKNQGANYAYLGNTTGSNISVLRACQAAGVQVTFLANVWGIDENSMKAAGTAANGVVVPVRTGAIWGGNAPGMETMRAISRMSDPAGTAYRPMSYIAGACGAMLMVEAMEHAAANGGQVTGERIREGFYARQNWVPKGFEGVCNPSTFTNADHRGMMSMALYRTVVTGDTSAGTVDQLMANGTMKLEKITDVTLPRRADWLGW